MDEKRRSEIILLIPKAPKDPSGDFALRLENALLLSRDSQSDEIAKATEAFNRKYDMEVNYCWPVYWANKILSAIDQSK